MADNTTLPVGAGGDQIRDIDRAGVKTQVVTLDFGGAAGPEALITLINGLPVQPQTGATWAVTGPLTDTQLRAAAVPVSGSVAVNVIAGFALDATVAKDATLATIDTDIKANQPRTVNLITGFALEAGHLATLDANTPTLGQKAMAGSRPVTLASDQPAVPVSAASLPLPAGAALETGGNLAALLALASQQAQLIETGKLQLAVLKAIQFQLMHISGVTIDPIEFINETTLN